MRIKYVGTRKFLSTTGLNRKEYCFDAENDYTLEVEDVKEVSRLLASQLHKFEILPEIVTEEVSEVEPIKEEVKHKEPKKKKEKKHG